MSVNSHSSQRRTGSRQRLEVRGLVQGVGFRPHVFRLASELGLQGFVQNDTEGVVIEVEGRRSEEFSSALMDTLPVLSRVDSLSITAREPTGETGFEIRPSESGRLLRASIAPDAGLCADCLQELFDPADRRYLHPFIACTNCGPRYSMARSLPYDRCTTSMADFDLCGDCAREYGDPTDRRFHAEPLCCHHCGPQLSAPVEEMTAALQRGEVVGIKGIGGFHLACNADDSSAVARLRDNKRRDGKPLAIMVPNLASARQYASPGPVEAELLRSAARPIVLLPATDHSLSRRVAPGLDSLGVMLPYTAVHYLLFYHLLGCPEGLDWLEAAQDVVLVMTSANISGDPVLSDNQEAEVRLAGVADRIFSHDRNIENRVDDSVVRVVAAKELPLRRARGFAPRALPVPGEGATVLALGAHLKNTAALLRGQHAWLSAHIGDLETPATLAHQQQTVNRLLEFLEASPAALACDQHADYASTRLAETMALQLELPLVRVQHHHAHVAAVLAEHGHAWPALGVALDGHGLGSDGEAWGGELLLLRGGHFERLGHWRPLPIAGGDIAAREPWRLAAGALFLLGRDHEIAQRYDNEPLASRLQQLLSAGAAPTTSAAGRWFDAAAGLLGVCHRADYEGQAPMLLESLTRTCRSLPGGFTLDAGVLDFTPLLAELCSVNDPQLGAELVHGTFIDGMVDWITQAADSSGLDTVALSGGCMVNRHLAEQLPLRLRARGLNPLMARQLPPNDGGLSLGQAWVARQQLGAVQERE